MSPHETFVQYLKIILGVFAIFYIFGATLAIRSNMAAIEKNTRETRNIEEMNSQWLQLYLTK